MKADAYGEIFLFNRDINRLLRVLQRLESASTRPKQEMKAYEVRLEEIRAGLNADFAEAMATRERDDEIRLRRQRTAWEGKRTPSIGSSGLQ
jgi:Rad3-related DNA helicase